MRAIEISLPLPPKELSPNGRPDRWTKWAVGSAYRVIAKGKMAEAMREHGYIEMWKRATWQATFTYRQQRHRDIDNLVASIKSGLDGAVTDARLLPGDDSRYLTMAGPPVVKVDKTAQEAVVLRFEEVA